MTAAQHATTNEITYGGKNVGGTSQPETQPGVQKEFFFFLFQKNLCLVGIQFRTEAAFDFGAVESHDRRQEGGHVAIMGSCDQNIYTHRNTSLPVIWPYI